MQYVFSGQTPHWSSIWQARLGNQPNYNFSSAMGNRILELLQVVNEPLEDGTFKNGKKVHSASELSVLFCFNLSL